MNSPQFVNVQINFVGDLRRSHGRCLGHPKFRLWICFSQEQQNQVGKITEGYPLKHRKISLKLIAHFASQAVSSASLWVFCFTAEARNNKRRLKSHKRKGLRLYFYYNLRSSVQTNWSLTYYMILLNKYNENTCHLVNVFTIKILKSLASSCFLFSIAVAKF